MFYPSFLDAMFGSGSGIFDLELLDDAPTVTLFTLDRSEGKERENDM